MNEQEKLLISVKDAMGMLSISRRTFYGLINSGHIASIKIGRKRLIVKDSMEKFIEDSVKETYT